MPCVVAGLISSKKSANHHASVFFAYKTTGYEFNRRAFRFIYVAFSTIKRIPKNDLSAGRRDHLRCARAGGDGQPALQSSPISGAVPLSPVSLQAHQGLGTPGAQAGSRPSRAVAAALSHSPVSRRTTSLRPGLAISRACGFLLHRLHRFVGNHTRKPTWTSRPDATGQETRQEMPWHAPCLINSTL